MNFTAHMAQLTQTLQKIRIRFRILHQIYMYNLSLGYIKFFFIPFLYATPNH